MYLFFFFLALQPYSALSSFFPTLFFLSEFFRRDTKKSDAAGFHHSDFISERIVMEKPWMVDLGHLALFPSGFSFPFLLTIFLVSFHSPYAYTCLLNWNF